MTALSMILVGYMFHNLGVILLWVAAVLTFVTGYQYFQKSLDYVKSVEAAKIRSWPMLRKRLKKLRRWLKKPRPASKNACQKVLAKKPLKVKKDRKPAAKNAGQEKHRQSGCQIRKIIPRSREMETDKAHILVVDDDTRLRSLLQRFLRENDFYVSVAKDAAEARERLSEYKFDLLIVDIMMPNESGLDFWGRCGRKVWFR